MCFFTIVAALLSTPALHNLCRLIYSPLARPDAPGCPNVAQIINVAQFINGSFNLSMLLNLSMLQFISMAWGRQGLPRAHPWGAAKGSPGPPRGCCTLMFVFFFNESVPGGEALCLAFQGPWCYSI